MAQLSLEAVCTGMVLDADVTNSGGHTLLKAGTELSARHLNLLHAHGIAAVYVGTLAGTDTLAKPPDPEQDDCSLEERFRHNDPRHPLIRELMRLHEKRRMAAPRAADSP